MDYTSALSGPTAQRISQATRVSLGPAGGRPKAAGRRLPLAGWLEMACSYAGGTGGLPPRPGFPRLTRVKQGRLWIDEASQIRREKIPLGARAARADLPALRTRFLLDAPTVTGLGEPRAPGVDQHDGPASTHSQTGQPLDKHARCAELNRLPVGPLPRPIGELHEAERRSPAPAPGGPAARDCACAWRPASGAPRAAWPAPPSGACSPSSAACPA